MAHTGTPGHNVAQTTGTTVGVAYTPTSGNLLIVTGYCNVNSATLSIADTAGNAWTQANPATALAGAGTMRSWWAVANGSSSTTVTITSPSNNFRGILVDEFSGRNTSTPIDNHAEASSGSVGSPTVSITPNVTSCDLYGSTLDSVSGPGAGFSAGADDGQQDISEFKNNISTGAQTVNYSGGASGWIALALTLAPTGGGPAFQPDEDYWDATSAPQNPLLNYFSSVSLSNLIAQQFLQMDQDLAGPLFGQPDEDYWSIFITQPAIPVICVFS